MRTKCSPAHSQSDLDLMMRGNLTHSRAPTPDQAMDLFHNGHMSAILTDKLR